MNELKARGVADVLIAVVDGLKGFPDAIEAVFPQATVQTCVVGLLKNLVGGAPDTLASRLGLGVCPGGPPGHGSVTQPITPSGRCPASPSGHRETARMRPAA